MNKRKVTFMDTGTMSVTWLCKLHYGNSTLLLLIVIIFSCSDSWWHYGVLQYNHAKFLILASPVLAFPSVFAVQTNIK